MATTIPENDIKASNLYFLGLVFSTAGLLLYPPAQWAQVSAGKSPGMLLPSWIFAALLMLGQGIGIRKSITWIKIVFALTGGYGTLSYMYKFPIQDDPLLKSILLLIVAALQGWAVFIVTRDLLRRPVTGEAA